MDTGALDLWHIGKDEMYGDEFGRKGKALQDLPAGGLSAGGLWGMAGLVFEPVGGIQPLSMAADGCAGAA